MRTTRSARSALRDLRPFAPAVPRSVGTLSYPELPDPRRRPACRGASELSRSQPVDRGDRGLRYQLPTTSGGLCGPCGFGGTGDTRRVRRSAILARESGAGVGSRQTPRSKNLQYTPGSGLAEPALPGPLSGPLSILFHPSHASLGCAGCTGLRHMRRFTGNPVCGTKFATLSPIRVRIGPRCGPPAGVWTLIWRR